MKCIFKKVERATLSVLNDERKFLSNNKSLPWTEFLIIYVKISLFKLVGHLFGRVLVTIEILYPCI